MDQAQKDTPRKGRKNDDIVFEFGNEHDERPKTNEQEAHDTQDEESECFIRASKIQLHDTIGSGTDLEVPTQIHEALKMPVSGWPVAGTKMARSAANFTTAIIKAIGRTKVLEEDEIIKATLHGVGLNRERQQRGLTPPEETMAQTVAKAAADLGAYASLNTAATVLELIAGCNIPIGRCFVEHHSTYRALLQATTHRHGH